VAASNNPYDAFNFIVAIDGIPAAAFTECILPAVSIEVIEYREGADVEGSIHKLPGLVKYGDLVLKRGLSNSAGSTALWNWISGFVQGTGTAAAMTVTLLDSRKVPVFQWSFSNAWPVKYEAPVLNGKTSALAIETLEVAVEGMKFSLLGQGP
jgi:phage tail-like protein